LSTGLCHQLLHEVALARLSTASTDFILYFLAHGNAKLTIIVLKITARGIFRVTQPQIDDVYRFLHRNN